MAASVESFFEHITPLALEVYNGKQIIFLVPMPDATDDIFIEGMEKIQVFRYPERFMRFHQQVDFVLDQIIKDDSVQDAVVLTESPIILSDALHCQIFVMKPDLAFVGSRIETFGSSPDRIAIHTHQMSEVIGKLSDFWLNKWLKRDDWTVESLEKVVLQIGGGWPRARLREQLTQLYEKLKNEQSAPETSS